MFFCAGVLLTLFGTVEHRGDVVEVRVPRGGRFLVQHLVGFAHLRFPGGDGFRRSGPGLGLGFAGFLPDGSPHVDHFVRPGLAGRGHLDAVVDAVEAVVRIGGFHDGDAELRETDVAGFGNAFEIPYEGLVRLVMDGGEVFSLRRHQHRRFGVGNVDADLLRRGGGNGRRCGFRGRRRAAGGASDAEDGGGNDGGELCEPFGIDHGSTLLFWFAGFLITDEFRFVNTHVSNLFAFARNANRSILSA